MVNVDHLAISGKSNHVFKATLWISMLSLTVFIGVKVFHLATARKASKKGGFPPGPRKSNDTMGNLGDMASAGSLHEYCRDLSKLYGPVFSFFWGTSRVVGIAHPDPMKSLRRVFNRPPSLFMGFSPLIGTNSVQYSNGQEGKTRHRVITHSFSASMIESFFDKLLEIGKAKVAELQGYEGKELEIDIERITIDMAIEGIVQSGFGGVSDKGVKRIAGAYHFLWDTMEERILSGEGITDEDKKFHHNRQILVDFAKQYLKSLEGDRQGLMIERLIAEPTYDEEKLLSDAVTTMVGGFHTTGTMMQWALYFLARDQKIQERLLDEINTVVPNGEQPSYKHVKTMEFLRNCIYETLRIAAVAPWAARVSDEVLDIDGFKVPAGTPVIMCLGVMQQSKQFWKDPERFDPDRFARADNAMKTFGSNVFMPFGGSGGRKCPGYRHTMVEGGLWIAMLVRAFELHLTTDKDPGIVYGLVSRPRDHVVIRLVKRDHITL